MVACCLTLLGQQESLERLAMVALQDTFQHMLTQYNTCSIIKLLKHKFEQKPEYIF